MVKPPSIWSRFSRITSSGTFIPEIDGLRFVAIISVVLFHIVGYLTVKQNMHHTDLLSTILSRGYFGVQLFFVISGFILSKPFAEAHLLQKKAPALKDYFLRRLTRLEPPYILNLILLFVLLIIVNHVSIVDLYPRFLASLFYQHNLIYGEASTINTVAWSLEVEVQFYVLAPLLALVFRIRSTLLRRLILMASMILLSWGANQIATESTRLRGSILYNAQYFITGFLLVDIYIRDFTYPSSRKWLWDLYTCAGIILAIALLLSGPPFLDTVQILMPFTILMVYAGVFRGAVFNFILTRPAIVTIGGMCYTIYLYHFAMISAIGRILLKITTSYWTALAMSVLVMLPAILAASSILFILFERPFMYKKWSQNVWLALRGKGQTP
ncbi:MAG: acyltransferase [Planctomycetota bacterium]